MSTRVRVCEGFAVHVDGKGQVSGGHVVTVDDGQAADWTARGWVEPVTATARASSSKTHRPE